MNWLIVEDALKNRHGHWLEWVSTFRDGFQAAGDQVTILSDAAVEPDIRELLQAVPILPPSIWHRLGDSAGRLTRYSRVFTHNWQTWRAVRGYMSGQGNFEAIFVPTVSVHHLLAWTLLIKRTLRRRHTRVLLFFIHAPLRLRPDGTAVSDGSPTARLMIWLIRRLGREVRAGKVVLGVETLAMQEALQNLTGVPFVFFPQPVRAVEGGRNSATNGIIRMACYGPARAEKGSDILLRAIELYRRRFPESRVEFVIQWIEDFMMNGARVFQGTALANDPQVKFLTRYFADGEYAERMGQTDVMLLPYRLNSYGLRGSRVVIEAAAAGIPVVATRGTTLACLAREYGAGCLCEDGDPESLAGKIREVEIRFSRLAAEAQERQAAARKFFSVETFRSIFLTSRGTANVPLRDTVTPVLSPRENLT